MDTARFPTIGRAERSVGVIGRNEAVRNSALAAQGQSKYGSLGVLVFEGFRVGKNVEDGDRVVLLVDWRRPAFIWSSSCPPTRRSSRSRAIVVTQKKRPSISLA
jgi:hypothetical protein